MLSDDSGQTWRLSGPPGSYVWSSVAMSQDGSRLIAAAKYLGADHREPGSLYIFLDFGVSWERTGDTNYWRFAGCSADARTMVTSAEFGWGIYISSDSGIT